MFGDNLDGIGFGGAAALRHHKQAMNLGYASGMVIWGFCGMRECGTTVNILVLLYSFLIGIWATFMLKPDYREAGEKNVKNLQLLFQLFFVLFFFASYVVDKDPCEFIAFCIIMFIQLPFVTRILSKKLNASYTVRENNLERKENK